MKKLMAIVSFLLLSAMASTSFAADFKSGVINMNLVYQKAPYFVSLNAKFVQQFKPRQDAIITAQKNLQQETTQLNSMVVDTSDELNSRNALQQKIYIDKQNMDIMTAELQRDVTVARYEMLTTFMTRFNSVVTKIAQDQHFDLIQQLSNNIFYVNKNIDITDAVIQQLGDNQQ